MRHDWEDTSYILATMRRCKNCGVEQERCRHTWYMRTTGYFWWPKTNYQKCPGTTKPKALKS